MTIRSVVRTTVLFAFVALLGVVSGTAFGKTHEGAAASAQAAPDDARPGAELAKETREAAGEEEESENLKHSRSVQWVAKKTRMTVHQAHLLMVIVNFLLVAVLGYWSIGKLVNWLTGKENLQTLFRSRTESIQRALEEARAASQDANRRLAEIEARLSKLDTEIASMQAQSEKEAEAEEVRIKQAAEEDIRKVVQTAEQEIAAAAKQARRELMQHTADLAVALARKQIHVDSTTDQVLVRNFAGKLSSGSGGKDRQ
jgi:F-type H+-transporting ATPase subunit b